MITEFLYNVFFGMLDHIVSWLPNMPDAIPFSFALLLQFNYLMPVTEIVTVTTLYLLAVAGLALYKIILAVIP